MSKTSLADAMSRVSGRMPAVGRVLEPTPAAAKPDQTATVEPTKHQAIPPKPKAARPKGRDGKKVISGFFDREASRQLARLAIDQDRSNESLLGEALNDLFVKYHLPPIA